MVAAYESFCEGLWPFFPTVFVVLVVVFQLKNEIGKWGPKPLALSPPRFPVHPFIYIFNFSLN